MSAQVPETATLDLLRRLVREKWRTYAPQYALGFVFMALVGGTTAASAWMMKDVINRIFVNRDRDSLVWIPLVIIAIFAVKGIASYFQEITLARIGNRVVAETQRQMFDHLLKMDVGFYQRHSSSDLITRITTNANAARDMLNIIALGLGRDLFTLVSLVIVMVSQDPIMAVIALTAGPVISVGLTRMVRRIRKVAHSGIMSNADIVGAMRETTQGIAIVKAFQLESHLRGRMNDAVGAVERMSNKMAQVQARVSPLVETMGGLAIALVVAYAGWRNLHYNETPGEFFAFITALLLAADPARRLSRLRVQLAANAVGVRMMYELIDAPMAEEEPVRKPSLVIRRGEVRFDKVMFAYQPAIPVLNELDLVAPAGCTTALVGLSGAGKSTIFSLLQRFWTPSGGVITIDGQSIADVSLCSLRRQLSLVTQDVFLFEGTIKENIKAGRHEVCDEAVIMAAKAAHADEFIRSLSRGYDTPVGELGSQISGGQRQRISIARAFLKDAPIVLLDEPTSALDSEAEQIIQSALSKLKRGRTTLVIAHRLTTILKADLIHVVDAGRVVESGTHAELIAGDGRYARLYRLQFEGRPTSSDMRFAEADP
jgi:ATP-binding cassette subfamily B protein